MSLSFHQNYEITNIFWQKLNLFANLYQSFPIPLNNELVAEMLMFSYPKQQISKLQSNDLVLNQHDLQE